MTKKRLFLPLVVTVIFTLTTCKKTSTVKITELPKADTIKITSPEFDGKLLFVNKATYQIQTNIPVTFSSTDSHIKITQAGFIQRFISGEVVPITVTDKANSGNKTTFYALASTDSTFDYPFTKYHALDDNATIPDSSYHQGWHTLQKLPVTNETYVIVLRHADASQGSDFDADKGPASWWLSCDSTNARQLNTQGVNRAIELGKIFKDLNYHITSVTTSELCRAIQTGMLINAGPTPVVNPTLNHYSHNLNYLNNKITLFNSMLAVLKSMPVNNQMSLIIAHHPINMTDKSGYKTFPRISPFCWTGAYFVKIHPDNTFTYEGAASWGMFKYWRDYKLNKL
jgi:phosphohistidine phosphatase SixA